MLSLVIGLLTIALVLTSVMLILMVLVQLPKKEAGLGMAFGGATADALFGAGSGTVLSQWTKYATGVFLVLSLVLSMLRNHQARASGQVIDSELAKPIVGASASQGQAPVAPGQPTASNPAAAPVLPVLQLTNPVPAASNAPAAAPAPSAVPTPPPAAETPAPAGAPKPGQ
jgi:protein translocase SecG subunit